jgi:hypothetical protein
MDAMVLQLEPVTRGSFKEYGPWHFRDQRHTGSGRMDFKETILHLGPAVVDLNTDFLKTNIGSRSPLDLGDTVEDGERVQKSPSTASTHSNSPNYGLSSPLNQSASGLSRMPSRSLDPGFAFSFSRSIPPVQQGYDFSFVAHHHEPGLSRKRHRAASDVDGPNTASQGCKKRRLRREMVTSRLSVPFSEPATHIINREFATNGDKHFLKLAAIVSARRMGSAASAPVHLANHPSPSSLLRRAAVINRFRLNVKDRAVERGDEAVADLATNAALLQQNHGIGFVVGARFPVTSSSAQRLTGLGSTGHGNAQQSIPPFQLSIAAVGARPRPTSPRLMAAEAARLKPPPSPKIRPVRSPVPGSARLSYPVHVDEDEGLDEKEVAFPTSEHESRYESTDEPDDVYADFGVIFGGGSADGESEDDEGDHYEDYMDDLDGIPWIAR